MNTKDFTPYQEALELKEIGFNEPCFGEYRQWDGNEPWLQLYQDLDGCSTDPVDYEYTLEAKAPTFSQAFRWFREKHDLVHRIDKDGGWWVCAILNLYDEKEQGTIEIYLEDCYPDTYEEAELACLRKLIKMCK